METAVRLILGLVFGSLGAYLIVRAIRYLSSDSDYFPPDYHDLPKKED